MREGLRVAREQPSLTLAWLVALCAPVLLAALPLDRALAPLLDLRPAARALVTGDDGLWLELGVSTPSLIGTAVGAGLVALCLGVPAAWLVAAFTAARAQALTLPASLVVARGVGVSLLVLPLRALPIGAAVLIAIGAKDLQTFAAVLATAATAATTYLVGASLVTVLTDFVRGAALNQPEEPLLSVLGAGVRAVVRQPRLAASCLMVELLLSVISLGSIAFTRPLGLYAPLTYAIGGAALVLRAFGSAALVAAAATAGSSRSA